jgi:hypothetical protein
MTDWSGNKGEWSETYAALKLLVDPLVPASDENLRAVDGKYYVVKSVAIPGENGSFSRLTPLSSEYRLSSVARGATHAEVRNFLPDFLKAIQLGSGSFEIAAASRILKSIGFRTFKAASATKIDIMLTLPSLGGGQDADLGFSIKSQLGSPSTLLNASSATNIVFGVNGLSPAQMDIAIDGKYADLRGFLSEGNCEYLEVNSPVFSDNLEYFGSDFPKKLGQLVLAQFLNGSASNLREAVSIWAANRGEAAERKLLFQLKGFLRSSALGMRPNSPWAGDLEGYGGYLIVGKNGELSCLHLENDDVFKNYLVQNTRFDWPKSELWLRPEPLDNLLRFAVNFQIRFLR